MKKMMTVGMLVLSLGVAAGCGDSIEHSLSRAQIAVNHAKFDHALELADTVLAQDPDNVDAARIKARALLQLGRLDAARQALDNLLKAHPDDVDLHELMVRWGIMQNMQLVNNSALMRMEEGRIVINNDMLSQIAQARQQVEKEAQWLANEANDAAAAEYARAELADLKGRQIARQLELLRTTLARGEEAQRTRQDDIKQLEAEMNRTQDELQSRLEATLAGKPDHRAAALRYNAVLLARQQWQPLWAFLQKSAAQEDLNESVAAQLTLSLLAIPANVQPVDKRLELGWKLTEAVRSDRRQTVDWWLTNARLHMMAGQYAKAVPLLEQVRSKAPRNDDARYLLASCYYSQNQFQQAHAILKDLAVKLNRSPNVQLLYGMTLRELGDNGAKEAIRRTIELDPDNALAREQMILLTRDSGDSEAVLQDLQALYDKDPTNPRAIRFMLQFLRAEGQTEKVAQLLTRVEQISPRREELLSVLVDGYAYLKQTQQAEQTAREWVAMSDKLQPRLTLAQLLLAQGKEEEAKTLIAQLKDQYPQQADLEELVGTLYLQQRAYDKAIEHLENVAAANPTNMNARLKLAQAQYSLALTDDALENVQKVLEQDPTHTEALSLAARIYQSQGKHQQAAETLARIDTDRIDVRQNPLLAAQIKAKAEQYDEAINIANQAIFAGDDNPALRLLLAAIYMRQGNVGQAEQELINLVRSQPDNWLAYSALATFYAQNRMTSKGVSVISGLSGANEIYTRLAIAGLLGRANEHQQALEQVQGLLGPMIQQRDPRTMIVASVIASLHVAMNQHDQARDVFGQLIQANLNVPQATLAQIDLDISQRDPQADTSPLRQRLEKLLGIIPPEQRGLSFQVVRRLAAIKAYDSALAVVDKWIADKPDDVSLAVVKGGLLMQASRNSEAARVYEQATKLAPENAQLWLRMGQAHMRGYEFPQAEAAFENLAKLGQGARAAALTELGQLYASLGLNSQATETFEELDREGNLRDPRIIYATAVAAKAIGKDDIALKRFGQVPKASSLYGQAQIHITQIDQAHGRIDEARTRLEELIRSRRTTQEAAQQLVNLNLRDSNNEQLIRWSDQMLSLSSLPESQRQAWLSVRSALAMKNRDWVGASNALEQLAALQPENPRVTAVRILLAMQQRKADEARQLLQGNKALMQSPVGASLATLLEIPVDPQAAKLPPLATYYASVIRGDADAARAAAAAMPVQPMLFGGDMLAALQRPDADTPEFKLAMKNLFFSELALALNQNELAAMVVEGVLGKYHSLGVAQSLHAKAQSSMSDMNRSQWARIAQDAQSTAMGRLASSQVKVLDKDYAGAAQDIQALLAGEPENTFVEYRLAGVLIEAGQAAEAIKLLEKIVASEGRFAIVACNDLAYMLALHQPDRLDEARKLAQKARQAMPNNPALLDTMGWIDHLGGDDAAALPPLVRASSAMRDSAEVHYHVGVAYAANGNKQWAGYHLEAATSLSRDKPIEGLEEAKAALR